MADRPCCRYSGDAARAHSRGWQPLGSNCSTGSELVEGSDERAAKATLEAEHAVQAIEFTAIVLEDFPL